MTKRDDEFPRQSFWWANHGGAMGQVEQLAQQQYWANRSQQAIDTYSGQSVSAQQTQWASAQADFYSVTRAAECPSVVTHVPVEQPPFIDGVRQRTEQYPVKHGDIIEDAAGQMLVWAVSSDGAQYWYTNPGDFQTKYGPRDVSDMDRYKTRLTGHIADVVEGMGRALLGWWTTYVNIAVERCARRLGERTCRWHTTNEGTWSMVHVESFVDGQWWRSGIDGQSAEWLMHMAETKPQAPEENASEVALAERLEHEHRVTPPDLPEGTDILPTAKELEELTGAKCVRFRGRPWLVEAKNQDEWHAVLLRGAQHAVLTVHWGEVDAEPADPALPPRKRRAQALRSVIIRKGKVLW